MDSRWSWNMLNGCRTGTENGYLDINHSDKAQNISVSVKKSVSILCNAAETTAHFLKTSPYKVQAGISSFVHQKPASTALSSKNAIWSQSMQYFYGIDSCVQNVKYELESFNPEDLRQSINFLSCRCSAEWNGTLELSIKTRSYCVTGPNDCGHVVFGLC